MARTIRKLTATVVSRLKAPGRHSDGGGLYLSVSKTAARSWVFIWTRKGKKREMGVGPYPALALADARVIAENCRRQVARGLDPITERAKGDGTSFGTAADAFFEAMKHEWLHGKTHYKWYRALTHYCVAIRHRPVAAITTEDVLTVLSPIWLEKSETASKLRGRIERVLDFAKARGWREDENPARWRGHLQNVLPKPNKLARGHLPAMDYRDVPPFVERLGESQAMSARALTFTILTAARTGEALNARWEEIDFDKQIWTVPAERMKGRIEHRVPLSEQALDVLRPLSERRFSDFVFPGRRQNKPLSAMAVEMLLRRMKVTDASVHGFRSSFRDWVGDETTFPREVAEAALAHKVGNAVERAYRRRDAMEKRRQLMQMWAGYCYEPESGKVVPIRQAATMSSR